MSETANYGLQLTDSDQETFLEWREKLNGQNNSNMQKIDKALGEKRITVLPYPPLFWQRRGMGLMLHSHKH